MHDTPLQVHVRAKGEIAAGGGRCHKPQDVGSHLSPSHVSMHASMYRQGTTLITGLDELPEVTC